MKTENTANPMPSVIKRLIPAAMNGKTITTIIIYKNEKKYCLGLDKEGFVVHRIVNSSRHGLFKMKIEWTNPTKPDGTAAELLAISEKARSRPMT